MAHEYVWLGGPHDGERLEVPYDHELRGWVEVEVKGEWKGAKVGSDMLPPRIVTIRVPLDREKKLLMWAWRSR